MLKPDWLRAVVADLPDGVVRRMSQDLMQEFRVLTTARWQSVPDVRELSWTVKGVPAMLEFRVRVRDAAPDRPRPRVTETVVVLHAPAPPFMRDRPCRHLGNYFCLCVASADAGDGLYRAWGEANGDVEVIWPLLAAYYHATFLPGYDYPSAGPTAPAGREPNGHRPGWAWLGELVCRCRRWK